MITIDQLLESVDLDFEPRFVTKDKDGDVWIWNTKPDRYANWHLKQGATNVFYGRFISERLKLSEFDGKDWTECIYEVPRKTTDKIEKIPDVINLQTGEYGKAKFDIIPKETFVMACRKINEVIDAVNELKGAKNE